MCCGKTYSAIRKNDAKNLVSIWGGTIFAT